MDFIESIVASGRVTYGSIENNNTSHSDRANDHASDDDDAGDDAGKKKIKKSWCCHCIIFTVLVFWIAAVFIYTAKGGLILTVYGIPRSCSNSGISSLNNFTNLTAAFYDRKQIFILVTYGFVAIFRIVQYLTLLISYGHYIILNKNNSEDKQEDKKKHPPHEHTSDLVLYRFFAKILLLVMLALPFLVQLALTFAVPSMGTIMEHLKCQGKVHKLYFAYCGVNFFRYIFDTCVIFSMLYVTFVIKKVWSPDDIPDLEQSNNEQPEQPEQPERTKDEWFEIVSKHYKILKDDYDKKGEKVAKLVSIFDKWFIVPWIIYVLVSSTNTEEVLKPWDEKHEVPLWPTLYYILFHVEQLFQIILAYAMALLMDSYEHKYYQLMRDKQLKAVNENHYALAHAQILRIEENENYRFMVKIGWSHITFGIDSPLFVLTLFLAPFLTVSGGLKLL